MKEKMFGLVDNQEYAPTFLISHGVATGDTGGRCFEGSAQNAVCIPEEEFEFQLGELRLKETPLSKSKLTGSSLIHLSTLSHYSAPFKNTSILEPALASQYRPQASSKPWKDSACRRVVSLGMFMDTFSSLAVKNLPGCELSEFFSCNIYELK